MRFEDEPFILWVDAICINQSNNVEKSEQIRITTDIYQTAPAVSIWLGHMDEQSSLAMRLIRFAAALYTRSRAQTDDKLLTADIMHYTLNNTNLQALASFFTKDWWGRILVVQEAAVAQHALFVCGNETLGFRDFAYAFFCWAALLKTPIPNPWLRSFNELAVIINGTSPRAVLWQYTRFHLPELMEHTQFYKAYTLEEMLEESWNFDSTDPRDKVYAWIGLLSHVDVAIVPDYDATIAEVYIGVVKLILEHRGSLSLISFTGSGARPPNTPPIIGLPSWAPDLRKSVISQTRWWMRPKSHRASGSAKANATISHDHRTLITDTIIAGRLCVAGKDRQENDRWLAGEKLSRWLHIILQNDLHLQQTASATGDSSDAFFRALTLSYHDDHLNFDSSHYTRLLRDGKMLRLGFMAYFGYLDRFQDCVTWQLQCNGRGKASPPYHFRGLLEYGPGQRDDAVQSAAEQQMTLGLLRPHSLNRKTLKPPPPEPEWCDFANFRRFFECFSHRTSLSSSTASPSLQALGDLMTSLNPALQPDVPSLLSSTAADWPTQIEEKARIAVRDLVQEFLVKFSRSSSHRFLLVTDTGYVGLGPWTSSVGDLVCVVKGCSLPIIATEHV